MATTTISALPSASTPVGDEYVVLDQAGATKKLLLGDLFLNSGSETITSLSLSNGVLTYTDEAGAVSTLDVIGDETVTSLSLLNGVLTYTDEAGVANNLNVDSEILASVAYHSFVGAADLSSEDYLISPVGFQPIIRGNISANRAAGTITIAEDGLYAWDFNCVVEPAISLGDFGGTHAAASDIARNCVMANYPGAVPTSNRIFGVIIEVNGTSTGVVARFGSTVPTASNRLDVGPIYDKAWLQAGDVVKFIFVGQEYPSHANDADVRFDMTNSRFSFYQEA